MKQLTTSAQSESFVRRVSKGWSKVSLEEKPLSENIGIYEAGDYLLTAAIWRTRIDGFLFDTYEIGIRNKKTNEFKLFQSDFDHQSVQEVAEAMAHLLSLSSGDKATLFYTPEWLMEHFK